MEKTFNQTTFVDASEIGIIDQHTLRIELAKYKALSHVSQEKIRSGMGLKHELYWFELHQIFDEKKSFTPVEFYDFKLAIEYYQDLEKYPLE